MAFGTKQLKKPTPSHIERWFKAISAISAVIIAWFQTVDFLPENAVKITSGILSLSIAISAAMVPFFGVQVRDNEYVPADEVTAMETDVTGGDRPPEKPPRP